MKTFQVITAGVALLLVSITIFVQALLDWASLPTVYVDPDGKCVIVMTTLGAGHDCGWETGRRYHRETVSYETLGRQIIERHARIAGR